MLLPKLHFYRILAHCLAVQTWGILKSRNKLATWMEVTLDAAPTTPEMTLFLISGLVPSVHFTASSSILVMEPGKSKQKLIIYALNDMKYFFKILIYKICFLKCQ